MRSTPSINKLQTHRQYHRTVLVRFVVVVKLKSNSKFQVLMATYPLDLIRILNLRNLSLSQNCKYNLDLISL